MRLKEIQKNAKERETSKKKKKKENYNTAEETIFSEFYL